MKMKDNNVTRGKRKLKETQQTNGIFKKKLKVKKVTEKATNGVVAVEELKSTVEQVFGKNFTTLEKSTEPNIKLFVGPWKNVEEFTQVYELLYGESSSLDSYRQALSMLGVWKLRRSTLCPAGVLATQIILEIILKDDAKTNERYINEDLQSLYAFAIIRFFNFMSSTVQEHKMRSMYDTAKMLDINSVVVDIRHLCSHGQVLPDLDMLRYVANYCLKWIKGHYWLPLVHNMTNVKPEDVVSPILQQVMSKLDLLLQVFDSAFLCFVHGASDIQNARTFLKGTRYTLLKTYGKEYKQLKLRHIINSVVNRLNELFHNARTISPDDAQRIESIFIEGLLKLQHFYKFPYTQNADSGFAKLYDAGQTLFRMLSVNGLMKQYFMALVRVCEATERFGEQQFCGASFWANRLVEAFETYQLWRQLVFETDPKHLNSEKYKFSATQFSEVPKSVRALLESRNINTRFKLIFGYAKRELWNMHFLLSYVKERLNKLNCYTQNIVKSLLNLTFPALQTDLKENLLQLIVAYQSMEENVTSRKVEVEKESTDLPIYTAANLMAMKCGKAVESNKIEQNNIWWAATENEVIDWSVTPLGKTPWELT